MSSPQNNSPLYKLMYEAALETPVDLEQQH